MKAVTYVFVFLLLLVSVSATCYNQDNSPFCSKDDPTCQAPSDTDSDGDGWSDSCDAFQAGEYFWVDYDGDGVGYGTQVYDCNDLDESITTLCGDTSLVQTNNDTDTHDGGNDGGDDNNTETNTTTTNSTTDSSGGSSSGSSGESSASSSSRRGRGGKTETIYVSDPNDNWLVQQEPVTQETEETTEDPIFVEKDIIPLSQPIPKEDTNSLTGAVTGAIKNAPLWPFFLLIAIVGMLLFVALRKREQEEN